MNKKAVFLLFIWAQFIWMPFTSLVIWKWNQQEIIRALCVNKEKPELNCGGCCHLKKVLRKTIQRELPVSSNKVAANILKLDVVVPNNDLFRGLQFYYCITQNKKFKLPIFKEIWVFDSLLKPPIYLS